MSTTCIAMRPSNARCARLRLSAPPIAIVESSGHYAISGRDLPMMTHSAYTRPSTYTRALGKAPCSHTILYGPMYIYHACQLNELTPSPPNAIHVILITHLAIKGNLALECSKNLFVVWWEPIYWVWCEPIDVLIDRVFWCFYQIYSTRKITL